MKIENKKVVQFHYTLKNKNGEVLESNLETEPNAYLHGYENIMPALEKALEGKQKGDQVSVTLAPEQAYGMRKEGVEQRIPIKHLQGAKKWKPGMVAVVQTKSGQRHPVTIVKVGKFSATVDPNHPFAGLTLTYDISIKSVRDATEEEITHGHAHGVGGHHHG